MDEVLGDLQDAGHFHCLPLEWLCLLRVVQINTFAVLLVGEQRILPVFGFYDLTNKGLGFLLILLVRLALGGFCD